ncbi:NAD-dependent epimerase/dehydratase family protein [bacterium]|nr:NAD-dependent epimerase/dehydratase family protein [bacterium]
MRVLVTGAAGFIGSHLTRALIRLGFRVVALDDLSGPGDWSHLEGVDLERVEGDISQSLPVEGPIGAVFHQASLTDTTDLNRERMFEKNCGGFLSLLEHALSWKAPLVWASSASVYGNRTPPQGVGDRSYPLNPYAESKSAMEDDAKRFCKAHPELTVVGLRYFNVFGKREEKKGASASMVSRICRQTRHGEVRLFEGGDQTRDFVPVESVVDANIAAVTGHQDGGFHLYNVGTGWATSFNEVVEIASRVIGKASVSYFPCPFPFFQEATQADLSHSIPGWNPVQPLAYITKRARDERER